jgi:xylose isomerase
VYGFLKRYGLENEVRVNIEANHATLAGHTFEHELATAAALGIFGSIDANRGDHQNGWDTDQFPNSVEELTVAMVEVLRAGGLHHRRVQLRFQGPPPVDGPGRPVLRPHRRDRHGRPRAAQRRGADRGRPLDAIKAERYAGWNGDFGKQIGSLDLAGSPTWPRPRRSIPSRARAGRSGSRT